MLIETTQSSLLVIDIQDRLAPAMHGREAMEANAAVLLRAAARLDVPVLVSEQYPKGLGHTVSALTGLFRDDVVVEKTEFSCVANGIWKNRFDALGRGQAIVCGIEAHVCVLQTCLELRAGGTDVFVVTDAITSRTSANKAAALDRLRAAGVNVVSTEMVIFEWLKQAGTSEFRDLSALIK